jgi:hypothetical protein
MKRKRRRFYFTVRKRKARIDPQCISKYVASILKTEEEQQLYKLTMQIGKAAQHCDKRCEVDGEIVETFRQARRMGKEFQENMRKSLRDTFRSISVEERKSDMSWDIKALCIALCVDADGDRILASKDYILQRFEENMQPIKRHLLKK